MTPEQIGFFIGGVVCALLGIMAGWCWRSINFAVNHECANPDHGDMTGPEL